MNAIERVMVWVAGADPNTLAKPECREAKSKYVGLGSLAIFPAIFAAAAGYTTAALWMPVPAALCAGSFAGGLVLNVERIVLAQVRVGRGWRSALAMIARLTLSAAFGLAITIGASLGINKGITDRELAQRNLREIVAAATTMDSAAAADRHAIRAERAQLLADLAHRRAVTDSASTIQEEEGREGRSPRGHGTGPLWRADSARYADLSAELVRLEAAYGPRLRELDAREQQLVARRDSMLDQVRRAQVAGPADRLRELYHLERRDPAVRMISLMVLFFCFAIDLCVGLLKMLWPGPDQYEDFVESRRREQIAANNANSELRIKLAQYAVQQRESEAALLAAAAQARFVASLNAAVEGRAAPDDPVAALLKQVVESDAAYLETFIRQDQPDGNPPDGATPITSARRGRAA